MKKTIEKNVVSISVWTALTVILSVIFMVWNVSEMKADFKDTNSQFNTRVSLLESTTETQQKYLYNLKADLKEDIEKNNAKLNDIYNLLLKINR